MKRSTYILSLQKMIMWEAEAGSSGVISRSVKTKVAGKPWLKSKIYEKSKELEAWPKWEKTCLACKRP
jgi:hypothetical protein